MSNDYFKQPPKEGMGFIYSLSDPITHEIRYIGLTVRSLYSRFKNHKNSAKNDRRARTPIQDWILKLILDGLLPEMNLIEEVLLSEINRKEIDYIAEGRIKYNLLNLANGGKVEGRKKGWKPSQETLDKLKKSARRGTANNKFFNRIGVRYGKLTVIAYMGVVEGASIWDCICDCGGNKIANTFQLQKIKSCGCARKERWDDKAKSSWREKFEKKIRRSEISGRYEKVE